MMVTWVRGLFKDIHGRLELDFERCEEATFEGEIDATRIWTGESDRDAHLRSADFFDLVFWTWTQLPARIGFEAKATINRQDFGVSWQDQLPAGGVVVGNDIELTLDAEAILLEDLEQTGAIEYYRD